MATNILQDGVFRLKVFIHRHSPSDSNGLVGRHHNSDHIWPRISKASHTLHTFAPHGGRDVFFLQKKSHDRGWGGEREQSDVAHEQYPSASETLG